VSFDAFTSKKNGGAPNEFFCSFTNHQSKSLKFYSLFCFPISIGDVSFSFQSGTGLSLQSGMWVAKKERPEA
jgi:hypothetical protein